MLGRPGVWLRVLTALVFGSLVFGTAVAASLAQLVEHALRKRMVTGSIPVGGYVAGMHRRLACS